MIQSHFPYEEKDGTWRFCTDYWKLNAITKKDCYPLPRIDDMLEKTKGADMFFTFDLASSFCQFPLYPPHKEKTAFVTHCGFYEYRVMPFGLTNAPATFRRAIELSLGGRVSCRHRRRHRRKPWCRKTLQKIRILFDVSRAIHIKLGLKKSAFFRMKTQFLVHVISKDGISVDLKKIQAVKDFPVPKSVKNIQQFQGLAGNYWRFAKGFWQIAKPMYLFLKKGTAFN